MIQEWEKQVDVVSLWEARFKNVRKRIGAKAKKAGVITEDDVFQTVS